MPANPQRPVQRAADAEPSAEASLSIEQVQTSFSGPVPDPATLKAYDMVVPGLAERIVTRWEIQSEHRA